MAWGSDVPCEFRRNTHRFYLDRLMAVTQFNFGLSTSSGVKIAPAVTWVSATEGPSLGLFTPPPHSRRFFWWDLHPTHNSETCCASEAVADRKCVHVDSRRKCQHLCGVAICRVPAVPLGGDTKSLDKEFNETTSAKGI